MSSVTVRGVTVRYDGRVAVDRVDEKVSTGEWLALIGPNGAGKSSLLRAIGGLVPVDGTVEVDGRSMTSARARERARLVAYVPQEPVIPDDMGVREYVLLGRWPHVGRFGAVGAADRRVAERVLERLRLDEHADRLLGELSGGERQRAVLARSLAQEAPVLLLDEPTSALDIGHQQRALELVAELRSDHDLTVIAAMHDLTLAGLYSDRVTMLDRGAVAASGSAAEVLTAERLGEVYRVCVSVDIDPDDGTVIVVPRRGFPV